MADTVTLSAGTADGAVIATDDIGGVHYQYNKIGIGAADTFTILVGGAGAVAAGVQRVTLASDDPAVALLGTIDTDTGNIATAVQLIDDTVYVDDADWTDDTSKHLLVGGLYQSSPQTVTDGDVAPFNITANGALHVAVQNTLTVASHAVTNAGTFVVQENGAALTALQLIDDPVATLGTTTYTEAATKGMIVGAIRRDADTTLVDTTNEVGPLQMDANGRLKVEVFDGGDSHTVDNGGTFVVQENGAALTALQLIDDVVYVDDTATHSTGTSKGVGIMAAAVPTDTSISANDIGMVGMTTDRRLYTEATIAAAQTLATVTTVSTVTALGAGTTGPMKAEDVAHATGDQGFPAWGVRQDTPNATAAASGDYHYLATDLVGGIRTALYETDFAALGTNHVKKYYTNAGAVTDGIVWSPAAGKRWYVTDIIVNVSAAATVTFEDDKAGGDEAIAKFELAANSGIAHSFATPWFSGEDAADLLVTTSAGNIYITVTGYEI